MKVIARPPSCTSLFQSLTFCSFTEAVQFRNAQLKRLLQSELPNLHKLFKSAGGEAAGRHDDSAVEEALDLLDEKQGHCSDITHELRVLQVLPPPPPLPPPPRQCNAAIPCSKFAPFLQCNRCCSMLCALCTPASTTCPSFTISATTSLTPTKSITRFTASCGSTITATSRLAADPLDQTNPSAY